MDKPTITINGEIKTMPTVKARVWRDLMKFDEECKKYKTIKEIIEHSEAVEKYCEIIARAFDVTTDEVLDNLEIDEVLPTYFSVLNYVIVMLTNKLNATNKKNKGDAGEN